MVDVGQSYRLVELNQKERRNRLSKAEELKGKNDKRKKRRNETWRKRDKRERDGEKRRRNSRGGRSEVYGGRREWDGEMNKYDGGGTSVGVLDLAAAQTQARSQHLGYVRAETMSHAHIEHDLCCRGLRLSCW